MKILYLEPRMDAGQKVVEALKQKGHALLLAMSPAEAHQLLKLHGRSVELAVVHRESAYGTGDPGLRFITQFKNDKDHQDLPFILTTAQWTEADCAAHQTTPSGANAYIAGLSDMTKAADRILEAIQAVSQSRDNVHTMVTPPPAPKATRSMEIAPSNIVLQEVEPIFTAKEITQTNTGISLEVPQEGPAPTSLHIELGNDSSEPVHVLPAETAQEDMPYLYSKQDNQDTKDDQAGLTPPPRFIPRGDAVIPGGAGHTPDVATLKEYLELREQDVATLSAQITAIKDQWNLAQKLLKDEQARTKQLEFDVQAQRKQLEGVAQERKELQLQHQRELDDTQKQLKQRTERARLLESKINEAQAEINAIRERVRGDIQKIRVREKELENKLEVVKKDAELLLAARENKIIELKRRLDIAEYNLDLVQERHLREKERADSYRTKLSKASQAMKLAEDMLDESSGT